MKLRDSALDSEEAVTELYKRIINSVKLESSYLILLAYDKYDVFSYTKDGRKADESSTVFSYVLCSICPIKLTKPALSYYAHDNAFKNIAANSVIAAPELGFMFPAFDNRTANIYNCLLYTSLEHADFAAGEFLYRIILKKGKIDFMKVCPNCQNQVNDDVAFCPICGTQFGNQQNTQNGQAGGNTQNGGNSGYGNPYTCLLYTSRCV